MCVSVEPVKNEEDEKGVIERKKGRRRRKKGRRYCTCRKINIRRKEKYV